MSNILKFHFLRIWHLRVMPRFWDYSTPSLSILCLSSYLPVWWKLDINKCVLYYFNLFNCYVFHLFYNIFCILLCLFLFLTKVIKISTVWLTILVTETKRKYTHTQIIMHLNTHALRYSSIPAAGSRIIVASLN